MEFMLPHALLLLVLAPLAVGWYLWQQRGRAAEADRFARLATRASVVAPSSPWRHAPALLFLLALVVLVFGAARPVGSVQVPQETVRVVLTLDISGSMIRDDVSPSRLGAAVAVAEQFARDLPPDAELGLVTFNHRATLEVQPTRDRRQVVEALEQLRADGGTAIGEAIRVSLAALTPPLPEVGGPLSATEEAGVEPPRLSSEPEGTIVLLSDGDNTFGSDPRDMAVRASEVGVPVYTVGLGDPNVRSLLDSVDEELLIEIAEMTDARYMNARDLEQLRAVYEELARSVALVQEKREQAWVFALAALGLALLGSLLSAARSNRLC